MKRVLEMLLIFLNGIRLFPLWILLKIRQVLFRDQYALLFNEDMFFKVVFSDYCTKKPEYIMILYHRIGHISYPFTKLCGTYPLFIPQRSVFKMIIDNSSLTTRNLVCK